MSISKKIRQARPKLSLVSPLVYSICWGFVVTNLFIAHSLLISDTLFILDPRIWGLIFLILSAGVAWGLVRNEWSWIKRFMTAGLFVKATWTIYLIMVTISVPSTSGVLGVWLLLAWVQSMSIIHFVPNGFDDGPTGG